MRRAGAGAGTGGGGAGAEEFCERGRAVVAHMGGGGDFPYKYSRFALDTLVQTFLCPRSGF